MGDSRPYQYNSIVYLKHLTWLPTVHSIFFFLYFFFDKSMPPFQCWIGLTNRFHVAVRLLTNRSQMTSKSGKNKKWHTRRSRAECVTDVLTAFWRLLWSITESDARQHGIYLFYIVTKSFFYFKIFQHNAKAGIFLRLCPVFARKSAIWRDLWFIQKEAILCVAKNCDWSCHGQTWLEWTEWTAEKCLDKRVQSKQTRKHKLGKRANRRSN